MFKSNLGIWLSETQWVYVIILHELTFNMEKYHNIALCLEQSGFINNYNKKIY